MSRRLDKGVKELCISHLELCISVVKTAAKLVLLSKQNASHFHVISRITRVHEYGTKSYVSLVFSMHLELIIQCSV